MLFRAITATYRISETPMIHNSTEIQFMLLSLFGNYSLHKERPFHRLACNKT
jgi:hypothetical protein